MQKFTRIAVICSILIVVLMGLNLSVGNVSLNWSSVLEPQTTDHIIFMNRLSRMITTVLVAISLPISGMLLQEYFKNILAGPSVLGVSSASGLGVAIVIFSGGGSILAFLPEYMQSFSLVLGGLLGAIAVLVVLSILSKFLSDSSTFIIVGFLISALASAIVSVLQLFSHNSELKQYVVWTFGSFSGLSYVQIAVYSCVALIGLLCSIQATKSLQGNILGEDYAVSVGVDIQKMKWWVLLSASILTGVTTSFVGPIAFIGIIIPYLARSILRTANLFKIFVVSILLGCIMMLGVNLLSIQSHLPINIITSFIGIPILLYIILHTRKI